jgi:hypothetical protein
MNRLDVRNRPRPQDFQDDYYIYDPSLPAAIVALVLWLFILVGIVYRSWRFKIWYLTVLVVGLLSNFSLPPLQKRMLIMCSGGSWIYS